MTNIKKVAINGIEGSNSDLARRLILPDHEIFPCMTFEEAFGALEDGTVDRALIPIDNSLAGRVADVHYLMARAKFFVIEEHFQPIRHALLGTVDSSIEMVTDMYTHVHAIPQSRNLIKELNLKPHIHPDTAAAARDVALWNDKTKAAIAPPLCAEIYGLKILRDNVQDSDDNTTRFLVLARDKWIRPKDFNGAVITSFYFEVRNIPAALYKAMGGFATNGVQMLKLESYVDASFNVARFYGEVLGHPDDRPLGLALEELAFFAKDIRLMGSYPAHEFRSL
jgi:prephenate dehydratase